MSLFVCMRPGCINVENTNLVTAKLGTDDRFPNMYRSEMMGISSKISRHTNGELIKYKEDIMMLCCECNCGTSHGEFEYSKATEEELQLAKISKYNMITPYDHGESIVKDNKAPHGYRLKNNQDILDEVERHKSSRKARATINGLLAMSGMSIDNFFKSKKSYVKDDKSVDTSNKLMFKAEIKRRIKAINKEIQISKDVYRLSELKHQLLEAKNLYKTS